MGPRKLAPNSILPEQIKWPWYFSGPWLTYLEKKWLNNHPDKGEKS